MTWCRGINSSNMMKTPSFYSRWQQYNTCLAAPTVTGKGHSKIEPKAKHFSHCKNYRSSRPNQTNNSKRLARILWAHIKSSEKNQISFIDNLDHKLTIHRISTNTPQKEITSNRSPRRPRRTLYWDPERERRSHLDTSYGPEGLW